MFTLNICPYCSVLGCPSFLGYRLPQFACIFFFTASFSARTARRLYVPPPWTPSSARDSFRRRTDFPFPRRTASRGVRSYTQPCLYLSFFIYFLFADARTSVQPMVQPAIVNSVKQRLFRTARLFFFLFAFFFFISRRYGRSVRQSRPDARMSGKTDGIESSGRNFSTSP